MCYNILSKQINGAFEMNDIFSYSVAVEIMDENENDPQTIEVNT